MEIYHQDSFINPDIESLISVYIREYDIAKANISILLSKGLISYEQYNYYYNLPPDQRKIQIGCLQRDNKEINEGLKKGFAEYRKLFFESNDLTYNDILSIKKDAIFIIDKIPRNTQFDHVVFRQKNEYTSYYRYSFMYNHYEFLYLNDSIHQIENLDVKGMGSAYQLHDNYMNDFFKCIFEAAEQDVKEAINICALFLENYVNRSVESGYYREYNPNSKLLFNLSNIHSYYMDYLVDEKFKHMLDISFNRRIIEYFMSAYTKLII